jgi:chorismate mutase
MPIHSTSFLESLSALRVNIDAIDQQLLQLIAQRCGLVEQVGALKHQYLDQQHFIKPGREAMMMHHLLQSTTNPALKPLIYTIWRHIIGASLSFERPLHLSCVLPQHSMQLSADLLHYIQNYLPFAPYQLYDSVHDALANNHLPDQCLFIALPLSQWIYAMKRHPNQRIFALVPSPLSIPIYAVAALAPEPAHKDYSIWLLPSAVVIPLSHSRINTREMMNNGEDQFIVIEGYVQSLGELASCLAVDESCLVGGKYLGGYSQIPDKEDIFPYSTHR